MHDKLEYKTVFSFRARSESCSKVVYKPVWYIPLQRVQWINPDDWQRNCPKHVEFHIQDRFEKLVHLVGFILRIFVTMHGHMNVNKNNYFFHVPESNKTFTQFTQFTHPTLNVSFLCLCKGLFEYPGTVKWPNYFHMFIRANFLTWYPVDKGSHCGHYFAFTPVSLPTRTRSKNRCS
jgi:hypothetical protein